MRDLSETDLIEILEGVSAMLMDAGVMRERFCDPSTPSDVLKADLCKTADRIRSSMDEIAGRLTVHRALPLHKGVRDAMAADLEALVELLPEREAKRLELVEWLEGTLPASLLEGLLP